MAQHANLTGNDLHEPKGIASAPEKSFLVADGAGSGTWQPIADYSASSYIAIYLSPQEVDRAFTTLNTLVPFSLTYIETIPSSNMTWDDATNQITYNNDKTCIVKFDGNISLELVGTGDVLLELFFQRQDASTGVWTTLDCSRSVTRFNNNSAHNMSWGGLCSLNPGDKLRPVARVDSAETFTVYNAAFQVYSTGICDI